MLQTSDHYTVNKNTLTIRGATESDQDQYWCRGQRDERPKSSQSSSKVSLTVTERPKPVVKVTPDQRVFRGETVTLTCDIQGGGNIQWTYSWFKDGSVIRHVTERVYTITSVSDSGEYSCRGERSDSQRSDISAAVTLTVSDLPTSTLTVSPDSPVFTGETVNLKCKIKPDHSDWRYEWYKGSTKVSEHHTVNRDTFTIRGVKKSDAGQYTCKGQRDGKPNSSQSSSAVSLSVTERPKPVVKVTPDQRVFRGETVTLTCDIQGGGNIQWTYSWFKDGSVIRHVTERVYTITSVSDSGEYSCRGERSDSQRSDISAAVTLTVSVRPKPVVKVTPDQRVFRGETVTLTCDIQGGGNIQWTYSWFKDGSVIRHVTERVYTITSVSDSGEYSCRGERPDSQRSDISAAVTLTVSDLPTSTLTVTPDSPVFTGETVNLKCVIESHSNWRYEWYKSSTKVSEHHTVNGNTLTIVQSKTSDEGQYTCKGHIYGRSVSSQTSSAVSLSVKGLKPKPELTSDPAGAALTGNTVTLICRMDPSTGWDFYWYKHTPNSETKTETNSYRVKIDSVSDGGQYWCRAGRGKPVYYTQYSDALWVNV
ncbi:carcinoembryonic antigen-related cell adhesion molecule 5-like, partial [Labeo rohita]|uniref:carcinoembryonic antigen-related cell adhesion molecule 5-like n=1 Tax=Labeo rohita TaxID=84645 RepID=UPI0021E2B14B